MKIISLSIFLFACITCSGQSLPDFSFTTSEGVKLEKTSLKPGKPVMIIYFDPFIPACVKQAEIIQKAVGQFANTTIIWASWTELVDLKKFKSTYFKNAKNIIAAKDSEFRFDTWFGYSEAPTVFVYDAAWMRRAKFVTVTPAADLLKAMK